METNSAIFDKYRADFQRIDRELEKGLSSPVSLVCDMGAHSLLGQGKRLRPFLFILSCRLCGHDGDDIYRLSTIFEYIHAASLIHDDILDNADIRRNKPSVNREWGNHAAVLEGDFLYSKCLSIAVSSGNLAFLGKLTDTALRMTEGQILELLHTRDWHTGRELYFEIIEAKTAALLSTSCSCGAILAQSDPEAAQALAEFGFNLGIAFQMADDLLDYTSDEAQLGKPVGKDLREGKMTLPLIYTLAGMNGEERQRLEGLFAGDSASDADHRYLIELVRQNAAIERVRKEALSYIDKASSCLDPFPRTAAKDDLLRINRYALEREH
ncbi:MAG: polyprenyl synthetase family protein [Deltaproteobacteria bacterium]|nr:polyprenyl synthetase family protein [Deltaproteobacteria bacterium]